MIFTWQSLGCAGLQRSPVSPVGLSWYSEWLRILLVVWEGWWCYHTSGALLRRWATPMQLVGSVSACCCRAVSDQPYFSLIISGGHSERGKRLDSMDSILCQTKECRRFKSDWFIQIKHVTSAYQLYLCLWWWQLASYPGLLTPVFVACSTNVGEGLVELSRVIWRAWTCGGVAHSFCTAVKRLSESKKALPRLSDVEHSVIPWSVFVIGSAQQ